MIAVLLSILLSLPVALWYHLRDCCFGEGDAAPNLEDPMTGRRTLTLSLGMAGFTWIACGAPRQEEIRPVEPRLTEEASYVPCRIDEDASDLVPDAVCGTQSRVPERNEDPPAADGVLRGGTTSSEWAGREIALGDLLEVGGLDELNLGIRLQEEATAADPHDARGWSDLAAVYLVRAQRADEPRDLLRAYEAASRALRENGFLVEARFNQALALEHLFLRDVAHAAWQDYLKLVRTSGWAKEAGRSSQILGGLQARGVWDQQEHLLDRAALAGDTRTVEVIVGQYRQAAREYAEQRLFGAWADAVVGKQSGLAANRLRILKAIGGALVRTSGEHLVYDSVAVIEAAEAGDPRVWRDLVQGMRDFRDGHKLYAARQTRQAVLKLTVSRAALDRARSPFAFRAAFFIASSDYIDRKYKHAIAQTGRLGQRLEGSPYGALLGHVYWIKALSEATLGRTQGSIEDYRRSYSEFRRLGERENAFNISCRLGEVLASRGRKQEAWQYIYRALRGSPQLRDSGQLATLFMIAGNAALQDGLDEAALIFQQERVRQSRLSNPLATVEAITWIAHFQHQMGDRKGALASLREAEHRVAEVEDSAQPRRKADIAMTEGLIIASENPDRAVALLTSALSIYTEDNNLIFALSALLARGRALRQAGNDVGAERDFDAALSLYDRLGESLKEEDFRLALLEEADSVFDEMVDLQADRDPESAFAYADRARTRVLPGGASKLKSSGAAETNHLLRTEPRPLPLGEIQRQLPDGVALVQFYVLPDRVLIWRLRRDPMDLDFFEQNIRREDLENRIARLRGFDAKDWENVSADLFDLLVRPWLATVAVGERIVLIPDKVLHRVAFAALRDRSNGDFLIETHPLAVAPSATLYVNALERQGAGGMDRSRGLVIGEPAIDGSLFGTLLALPAAKREAERLAARTGARLITGDAADKAAFLEEATRAEWIQFSGHAVVDPSNTLLSKLVLAPGADGDPGMLTAREIYSLKLDGTRLVILAACDTGNEYVPGGEGATSLARAFLAAGVPTVVASLWSVDDDATARLFDAFHHHLLAGSDPVDALRLAQRAMLGSQHEKNRSPRAWAAFEVIGASAEGQP
jgi:CHAT domain-containing protein/tetratricopeptide (TPR) repeat protein